MLDKNIKIALGKQILRSNIFYLPIKRIVYFFDIQYFLQK